MRGLAVLLGLLLFPSIANAYDAPFGLRWGMTVEETVAMVGKNNVGNLKPIDLLPVVMNYQLPFVNAPLTPSNTNKFVGEFTEDAGLIGVSWISADISTDELGSEGYDYYLELKNIISEKYKPEKTHVHIYRGDIKLKDEPFMLYDCLAHHGCGKYRTSYQLEGGGSIQVDLHRRSHGVLFATVEYHADSYFESLEQAYIRAIERHDQTLKQQEEIRQRDKKAF